ncbi:MAG TPA: hypothetical protein VFH91_04875 [Pyrinomonadaceae bacterium]|nr:hypothetical protein [Pyrinomonadaceae bacterium]
MSIPKALLCLVLTASLVNSMSAQAQQRKIVKSGSHPVRTRASMSPAERALIDEAILVVCSQAKLDPNGSLAIDEMQARPSLPVHSPEALAGAARAQRLLPVAKTLVISSLTQLMKDYGLTKSGTDSSRLQQSTARVQAVIKVKPDMEARDNASVYLNRPRTITFGTLFLAGLRSDEGMVSVLAHELVHIADGPNDNLRVLINAIADKASSLTGLEIHGQRAEELTCDLIGAMAVRTFVGDSPGYESVARRLARSVEHNCVTQDEGDEEHLSPRSTIRALLSLNPQLVRELVNDQEEVSPKRTKN